MTRLLRTGILPTFLCALLILATPGSARALELIRDAEIERTLDRISDPLFRAAGLSPAVVNIYIVNSSDMNAFVAGGQNIFLHTGLLTRLETVDQLRAVIAHETGHIAGGHLTRRNEALKGARGVAALGMIGALAATAAGSPEAGLAIVSTSRQAATRNALAHSRAEESAADQAGLRYLAYSRSDPEAFLEVMRLFKTTQGVIGTQRSSYTMTHPLWSERLALIEAKVRELPKRSEIDPETAYWHSRMVAKLDGFLDAPRDTLRRYPADDASEPTRLARAVALHRLPDPAAALAEADALIALRPDDAYYHELKGQFLLEIGRAEPAAASYRQAVELAPRQAQILGGLGRSLLNMETAESDAEALDVLREAARLDVSDTGVWRDLALAEARSGNDGAAALATAERFFIEGRPNEAIRNAARALDLIPRGAPGWRRAEDLTTMAQRASR